MHLPRLVDVTHNMKQYSAVNVNSEKRAFWLIKFAPFRTAWAEIVRRGAFTLRGVRSPEARKNLMAMRSGDYALYYHSQRELAIVGILEVSCEAYPDPTSADSRWLTCDFQPVKTLSRPVTLAEIKASTILADIPLIRRPRLAVMPLSKTEYDNIIAISESSPKSES